MLLYGSMLPVNKINTFTNISFAHYFSFWLNTFFQYVLIHSKLTMTLCADKNIKFL